MHDSVPFASFGQKQNEYVRQFPGLFWRCPDEISRLSVILAAVRDGLNIEELLPIREQLWHRYGTKVGFINTPNFSVSSNVTAAVLLPAAARFSGFSLTDGTG